MTYNDIPPDRYMKRTLERMDVIKQFMREYNRLPKRSEVMTMFGLQRWAANNLIMKVRRELPVDEETWEDLGRKVIENILERVRNKEDPLDDALLIKLLQHYKPIKKDVQEIVGGVEVIHRLVIEKPDELLGTEEESTTE